MLHTLLWKDESFPRWWIPVCKDENKGVLIASQVWVVKIEWLQKQQTKEKFRFQLQFPLTRAFTSLLPLLQPANQWHPCKLYLGAVIACRRAGAFLWILISSGLSQLTFFSVCIPRHCAVTGTMFYAVMPPRQQHKKTIKWVRNRSILVLSAHSSIKTSITMCTQSYFTCSKIFKLNIKKTSWSVMWYMHWELYYLSLWTQPFSSGWCHSSCRSTAKHWVVVELHEWFVHPCACVLGLLSAIRNR